MNYSSLKSRFYGAIGENAESPSIVPEASLLTFVNRALRRVYHATGVLEKAATIAATASVSEYALPTDCDKVLRVAWNGERLAPVTKGFLLNRDYQFATRTGTPWCYYLDEIDTPMGGAVKVGLYPAPSTGSTYAEYSGEYGVEVAGGEYSSEYGIVVTTDAADPFDYSSESGLIVGEITDNYIEVHYQAVAAEITDDDDSLGLPAWADGFVLWSALSSAFDAGTMIEDADASAMYAVMAEYVFSRIKVRSNGRLPKTWTMESGSSRRSPLTYKDRLTLVVE